MFQFRDATAMLPSELQTYVKELEEEVKILESRAADSNKPNAYVIKGVDDYKTEQEMLDSLEVGEVVEALGIRKLTQDFKVKLSDTRIDSHPTRIAAEHVAMLHGVKN